jgi:hypothetical protein
MSIRFIDPKNASSFKEILNADPELKIAACYMTKDVCIEVGNTKCIVKFRDGIITQIKSEDAFADPWDFAVRASLDAWEKFLQPIPPRFYDGIFGGMVRGNFRLEGDTVSAFSHFWAVTRMLDIFRELENK